MNLLHLKYAVEVEKTRSINKAAEALFMQQPNLSRAIKELENSLGITIFKRTSKGMYPTAQGEEFLRYARSILTQIDEVEAMYQQGAQRRQRFSVAVPCAAYIAQAFASFVKSLDETSQLEYSYKETNASQAIDHLLQENYSLAVVRYQPSVETYFNTLFYEKGLKTRPILEFSPVLLMSAGHPLAEKTEITKDDLAKLVEIAYSDPYIPSLPTVDVKKIEYQGLSERHIFVFDRGSQFDLLSDIPGAYMWDAPVPSPMLSQHGLIQKACCACGRLYKDVLVYRKDYHLTDLDKLFIKKLQAGAADIERLGSGEHC